jgi:predicted nucleic acid-binding Zn ribbon protein
VTAERHDGKGEGKDTGAATPRRTGRPKAGGARRPPRIGAAQTASQAVAAALELHGITDQVRASRVLTEWSELVGPRIAQRTRPDGVTDRMLWVEVATSAWLHELNLLRPQLLGCLLERLGEPTLFDDLRFRLTGGRRRDPVIVRAPRRPAPPPRPAPAPATGAARERIVREAAAVDDAELRELIARVRITHDR